MSEMWGNAQNIHPDIRDSELVAGLVWIEQSEYNGTPNGRLKLKWSIRYSFDNQPMRFPATKGLMGDHPERVITAEDVWIGGYNMIYYYPDTDSWLGFVPGWHDPLEDRWFECGVPVWGY